MKDWKGRGRGFAGGVLVRAARITLFVLIAAVALASHAPEAMAQARTHQVTWAHSASADVHHFVVLISQEDGGMGGVRQVDVGKPASQRAGAMEIFSAMVSFEPHEYLAVAAVGHDGQMSVPSGWGSMPPTRPGQPVLIDP